jgi:hypothetical protein
MADIRTTSEEFTTSGSLANVKTEIESDTPAYDSQEVCQFLAKKIDELIEEVNKLKNG